MGALTPRISCAGMERQDLEGLELCLQSGLRAPCSFLFQLLNPPHALCREFPAEGFPQGPFPHPSSHRRKE